MAAQKVEMDVGMHVRRNCEYALLPPTVIHACCLVAVGALAVLVGRRVDTDGPTTGVGTDAPFLLGHPSHGSSSSRIGREVMLENLSDPVCFFGIGRLQRVSFGTLGKLLVGYSGRGVILHSVNPRVADTVRELLLLSP